MSLNSIKFITRACFHLLLLLLLLESRRLVSAGSIVKSLPGFPGDLPFKLETGYVSVEDTEMFYLFVESQGNPRADPLLIYLIGGPGCSALNGFFYQVGPLTFNVFEYSGGLPLLIPKPYSWTQTASIIFVDAPVGTGYSYANTTEGYIISDTKSARQIHIFLRQWLKDHTEFVTHQTFIASDSYSGLITPIVVQEILQGNEVGLEPKINLIGYLSGSPHADSVLEDNAKIPFAHRMALISDRLYESAKKNCKGRYIDVQPSNAKCLEDLEAIDQCLDPLYDANILEPKCATLLPNANDEQVRRLLKENSRNLLLPSSKKPQDFECRIFIYLLSSIWANDKSVQKALHVREGTVTEWVRCNISLQDNYIHNIDSVIGYHKNLSKTGLQVLLYGGDHDTVVPHLSTEEWIRTLNLTLDTDWRSWLVDGQVAGYTVKYTNYGYRLTYATAKGSGHSPTEYMPKECYNMFERWIHYYPL